jgi:hypothetical protein
MNINIVKVIIDIIKVEYYYIYQRINLTVAEVINFEL